MLFQIRLLWKPVLNVELSIFTKCLNHFSHSVLNNKLWQNKAFYMSYYILKLQRIPFSPFIQNLMKITYILLWKNCNVGTTCEFYICLLNYPLFFQISANYEKILLKFVSLSIALARPGAILSVEGEITCIKKV